MKALGTFARLTLALAIIAGACAPQQPVRSEADAGDFHSTSHRRFDDVGHWRRVFDAPERTAWQNPEALIAWIGIEPGMRVADVGAGTGYFLPYLSRAVGTHGRVIAVEVEQALVDHMRDRVVREALTNVDVVLSRPTSLDLLPESADAVVFVDAYHHVDRRREYLATLARLLTRGGRVVIVDWKAGKLPVGPQDEAHKLPATQVIRELEAAGFRNVSVADVLPYQYVLVFTPIRE